MPGEFIGGRPDRTIAMLIGEAPGEREEDVCMPWIGKAGTLLRGTLMLAGISEIYVTNSIKHRPPNNRTPTKAEIEECQGFLYIEGRKLYPRLVILAGKTAEAAWDMLVEACADKQTWMDIAEVHRIYHPSYVQRPQGVRFRAEWENEILRIGERYRALGGVTHGHVLTQAKAREVIVPEPWEQIPFRYQGPWEQEWLAIDTETDDGEKDWSPKRLVATTYSDGRRVGFTVHSLRPTERAYYHNAKYDVPILCGDLWDLDSWDDTMLMAYVLREPRVGLKEVGPRHTGIEMEEYDEVVTVWETRTLKSGKQSKPFKRKLTFSELLERDPEKATEYACRDAVVTSRLAQIYVPMLQAEPKLWSYYQDFEKPLTPVLYAMERGGIRIDTDRLVEAGKAMTHDVMNLAIHIEYITGNRVTNPGSPIQVANELQRRGYVLKETATGKPSADEPTLLRLRPRSKADQAFVDAVLAYRKLQKMKGTYVEKLPRIVDDEGHAHARFNQAVTDTNRLSSSDPMNFQNIPNRDAKWGELIRGAFLPDPGQLWVKADMSQLQLRVFAHYTREPVLLDAYCSAEERDVHSSVAEALGIERPKAKNGIFATLFGVHTSKLAATFGVPESEAGPFLERIKREMPSLVRWPKEIEQLLFHQGYVESLFGWRMPYPLFFSPVQSERAAALREGMCGPIQATEAGIMKKLMRWVGEETRPGGKLDEERLLLQVHDEVGLSMYPGREQHVKGVLLEMGRAAGDGLCVPLRLDVKAGANWYTAEHGEGKRETLAEAFDLLSSEMSRDAVHELPRREAA